MPLYTGGVEEAFFNLVLRHTSKELAPYGRMNGLDHQRMLANTISSDVQFQRCKVHSCKVEAWKPFPNLDA
jgi:hypothetical protein